ncbi:hypothetical protein BGZ65_004654 [Modicella reniformis]|uniref:Uncharacterized protein n=1 Tax=Modicella reniformis TaxID=1440133 RepID=A0A9P6SVC4_9FUNG|nr:hypothetical protein BGZ65_004654 [Modicella reniformis]
MPSYSLNAVVPSTVLPEKIVKRTRAESTPVPVSSTMLSLMCNKVKTSSLADVGIIPSSAAIVSSPAEELEQSSSQTSKETHHSSPPSAVTAESPAQDDTLTPSSLSTPPSTDDEPSAKHDPDALSPLSDNVSNGTRDDHKKDSADLPPTETVQVTANPPIPKRARRSSKLFGKFVPKFLQTSFGPSSSAPPPHPAPPASSAVPRSARTARPCRSASFTSGSSSPLIKSMPLPLPIPDSVPEVDEESFVSDSSRDKAGAGLTNTTTSSAPSPVISEQLANSDAQSMTENSQGSVDVVGELSQEMGELSQAVEQINKEGQEDEGHQYNLAKDADEYHSSYIIDENCDDDFFLNSVLRKKNQPDSPAMLSTRGWSSSSLEHMPSLTHSRNSTTTSLSSQTSSLSGSPITPMCTSSLTAAAGSALRSSHSSPIMIQPGLDEKRSRLSDAVREWRRSTNASSSSVSSSLSYTGFAM